MTDLKSAQKTVSNNVWCNTFEPVSFFPKNSALLPLRDRSKHKTHWNTVFIMCLCTTILEHTLLDFKSRFYITRGVFPWTSFFDLSLRGGSRGEFFGKNESGSNVLYHTLFDTVFCADFKSVISLIKISHFYDQNKSEMCKKDQ